MERRIITISEHGAVNVPTASVWMTCHELADLFECFVVKVSSNIKAILKTRVLDETKVCRNHRYKNGDSVDVYGLELIIALSFRINSRNAHLFRELIVRKMLPENIETPIVMRIGWNNSAILN